MGTNPGHDLATVTEEMTIESGKSSTLKVELRSTIMGEQGISVLKERDQDEPVVNPADS